MEAHLLYIRENEMNDDLSRILNAVERSQIRFFILVEINPIQDDSMPMINGLKEIRLNKVEDKIEHWFKENLSRNIDFELSVFEGKPRKGYPSISLVGINKLLVFVDSSNDLRIVPFIKTQLKPSEITFLSIEGLINKNRTSEFKLN
jgi:hypothetical protein